MLYFNSRSEIDGSLTAIVSDEMLAAQTATWGETSVLRGGEDGSAVAKELEDFKNNNLTATIIDFKASRYYYLRHKHYQLQFDKSFKLYKLPGQVVEFTNTGVENIQIDVVSKTTGVNAVETISTVDVVATRSALL